MQCSSCAFENMPGSDSCGRCGSSLKLATMTMDVAPPRAGKFKKRVRRVVPVGRTYFRMRDSLLSARQSSAEFVPTETLPAWALFWRLIVPGSSHLVLGKRIRAHLFFWGFLAFFLPSLLSLGTTFGSI